MPLCRANLIACSCSWRTWCAAALRRPPACSASRSALDELKEASLKAADSLRANCSTYRALTPVGRVESMEQRLEATLGAVRTVKPALARFYDLLSDEQKARFNALRSDGSSAQGG
jgi:LTXXQ motif family protein